MLKFLVVTLITVGLFNAIQAIPINNNNGLTNLNNGILVCASVTCPLDTFHCSINKTSIRDNTEIQTTINCITANNQVLLQNTSISVNSNPGPFVNYIVTMDLNGQQTDSNLYHDRTADHVYYAGDLAQQDEFEEDDSSAPEVDDSVPEADDTVPEAVEENAYNIPSVPMVAADDNIFAPNIEANVETNTRNVPPVQSAEMQNAVQQDFNSILSNTGLGAELNEYNSSPEENDLISAKLTTPSDAVGLAGLATITSAAPLTTSSVAPTAARFVTTSAAHFTTPEAHTEDSSSSSSDEDEDDDDDVTPAARSVSPSLAHYVARSVASSVAPTVASSVTTSSVASFVAPSAARFTTTAAAHFTTPTAHTEDSSSSSSDDDDDVTPAARSVSPSLAHFVTRSSASSVAPYVAPSTATSNPLNVEQNLSSVATSTTNSNSNLDTTLNVSRTTTPSPLTRKTTKIATTTPTSDESSGSSSSSSNEN